MYRGPAILMAWAMLAQLGCTGGEASQSAATTPPAVTAEPARPEPTTPQPKPAKPQENPMKDGALSPSGDKHPGEIVHEDKVDGRTWTKQASEVPPTIAWVRVDGAWKPVTRIEITGAPEQRRITKLGQDGAILETTIQQRKPRPAPSRPTSSKPSPTPTPTPTPSK